MKKFFWVMPRDKASSSDDVTLFLKQLVIM